MKPKSSILVFLSFIIISSLFCFNYFRNNEINLDAIFYTGCAIKLENNDIREVHNRTFNYLKEYLPHQKFDSLFDESNYKKLLPENVESFAQQLDFYKSRLFYISLIYLIIKAGINPFYGGLFLSTIFVMAGLSIILYGFKIHEKIYLFIVSLIISLVLGTGYICNLVTPDSLIFLFICLILYLLLKQSYTSLLYMLIVLLIIKLSMFIFVFQMIFLIFILDRKGLINISLIHIVTVTVLSFIIIIFYFFYINEYSWDTLFYHTFINYLSYPYNFTEKISISQYTIVLFRNFSAISHSKPFLIFIAFCIYNISPFRKETNFVIMKYMNIINLIFVIIHFLLFPNISERFFVGIYFSTFVIFLFNLDVPGNNFLRNQTTYVLPNRE
ncbi:MAG TPA: hypothetical protein VIL99_08105 [Ignavibacteria bacterium]